MSLTLLHSKWPKLHRVLAVLSAIGFNVYLSCANTEVIDRSVPAVCLGFLDAAFISQEGFEGMKNSPEFTYDDGSLLS